MVLLRASLFSQSLHSGCVSGFWFIPPQLPIGCLEALKFFLCNKQPTPAPGSISNFHFSGVETLWNLLTYSFLCKWPYGHTSYSVIFSFWWLSKDCGCASYAPFFQKRRITPNAIRSSEMILEYHISVGIPASFFPKLCVSQAEVLCAAWILSGILIFLLGHVLLC